MDKLNTLITGFTLLDGTGTVGTYVGKVKSINNQTLPDGDGAFYPNNKNNPNKLGIIKGTWINGIFDHSKELDESYDYSPPDNHDVNNTPGHYSAANFKAHHPPGPGDGGKSKRKRKRKRKTHTNKKYNKKTKRKRTIRR